VAKKTNIRAIIDPADMSALINWNYY